MIGNLIVEIEPAEPAVRKVKCDLPAKLSLETHAITVADNQHPDHQLRIDRRPADLAIEGRQLLAQVSQYPRHDRIDPSQEMAYRNTAFQIEQIEQLALIARLPTHHEGPPPLNASSRRNHCSLRKSRRLFQHYRPTPDLSNCSKIPAPGYAERPSFWVK